MVHQNWCSLMSLGGLSCVFPRSYVKTPALVPQTMTVYRDRAIKEMINLKYNLMGALIRGNLVTQRDTKVVHAQRKDHVRTQQEDKPKREA